MDARNQRHVQCYTIHSFMLTLFWLKKKKEKKITIFSIDHITANIQ